jgi:hypothetical protein
MNTPTLEELTRRHNMLAEYAGLPTVATFKTRMEATVALLKMIDDIGKAFIQDTETIPLQEVTPRPTRTTIVTPPPATTPPATAHVTNGNGNGVTTRNGHKTIAATIREYLTRGTMTDTEILEKTRELFGKDRVAPSTVAHYRRTMTESGTPPPTGKRGKITT